MTKTGTHEWSTVSRNIQKGCGDNDCLYCYAREMALRFHHIGNVAEWTKPAINRKAMLNTKKVDGVVMFPSTHDIYEWNMTECTEFILNNLKNGNKMLIVSKPRMNCIYYLCERLQDHKSQIKFRFTIGSADDSVLKFWEPGAPGYLERVHCVHHAHAEGYQTSISCEPYLDDTIYSIIREVEELVTDTIWIGRMNKFEQRVDTSKWGDREWGYAHKMFDAQTDDAVLKLHEHFKDNEKVKWKDSIKKVLGLPEEEIG